jgi:hypothetical protein
MYPPISFTSESSIRKRRQLSTYTDRPQYVAIRPVSFDANTGQRWQAIFYPTPGAAYDLEYRYKIQPQMLGEAYPNPLGGPDIGELILECCLSIAEQRYKDEQGLHTATFIRKLAAAIDHDNKQFAPDTLGYNGDRSDGARRDRFDGVAVHSFNGVYYYD